MSATATQVQFVAEFVTLLVCAAGLALDVLRSGVARSAAARFGLGAGFVVAGAAAFAHGSLLVSGDPAGSLGLARLAGAALVLASLGRLSAGRRARLALGGGSALWVAAGAAEIGSAPSGATDGLLVAGSLAAGAALVAASRGSIATRIAASAAVTLLAVVLVLAVALSAVILSAVQADELDRLASGARLDAAQISETAASANKDARFVAGDLQGYFRTTNPNPLIDLGAPSPADATADASAIGLRLQELRDIYPVPAFAYASAGGREVIPTSGLDPGLAGRLASRPEFAGLSCSGGGQGSLVALGGRAWAVGAYPECLASPPQLLGTVFAVTPVGDTYLAARRQADPSISLALVVPGSVAARSGAQPPPTFLADLVQRAARHRGSETFASSRLTAVVPIPGPRGPAAYLVASTATTSLISTRDQLFRTLFLIALGGTLLALGVASVTGDRITAGVRRLTEVARRIQEGNTSERARIVSRDEVGLLGAAFDSMVDSVEEQNAALQAAADDETRLRSRLEAIVAGMSDALVATDASGRVTDLNRAAEELTGVNARAARGQPVDRVVNLVGEDGAPLGERLRRPSGSRWALLAELRHASGTQIPVAVSAGVLRGPGGELAGSVLVLRDLRREREVERMKTELLSRVGHELRTPLTGILGYADILMRREVPPAQARQWHSEIVSAAKRLQRIVEMLEFFASSVGGRILLRPEPLDVRALVSGVANAWSSRLPAGVTVAKRVARDTPPVLGDRRWLALAVDELIDNAVKFSPGGGRVTVSARPVAAEEDGKGRRRPSHGWVEVSVSDSGVGMSEEELAVAFGEFVQADGSDTRRFGGLGLGLALVSRVVEGHGGTISCRSVPGQGSTFTLRLPASAAPRRPALPPSTLRRS